MTIFFLVAEAFPSSFVKTGVRTEKYFSAVFNWRIETRFLARFRFHFFMVVWSCGWLPHFRRTCYLHLQGRRKNRKKKMEVTGSSGPSMPTLKVRWRYPKDGDAFWQSTAACDVPGIVAVLPIEGGSPGRSLFSRTGQRPICVWMWVRFCWAVVWTMQMMCGTKTLANPIPEPATASFGVLLKLFRLWSSGLWHSVARAHWIQSA